MPFQYPSLPGGAITAYNTETHYVRAVVLAQHTVFFYHRTTIGIQRHSWEGQSSAAIPLAAALKRPTTNRPLVQPEVAVHLLKHRTTVRNDDDQTAWEHGLEEQQQLASLGQMTRGIAHDFNNLLTQIHGYAELALLDKPDQTISANLESILTATQRAIELTRQILLYSRRGQFSSEPLSLTLLISEMSAIFEVLVRRRGTLIYRLDPDLPLIMAHPARISQVIINLLLNAADAITTPHGTITITTASGELDAGFLQQHGLAGSSKSGSYVRLSISDTGAGMDEETLTRIFDPFFTTKKQGNGLGLSIVQEIVRAHQGLITVESILNQGTRFDIWFPIIVEHNHSPPARQVLSFPGTHGTPLRS